MILVKQIECAYEIIRLFLEIKNDVIQKMEMLLASLSNMT